MQPTHMTAADTDQSSVQDCLSSLTEAGGKWFTSARTRPRSTSFGTG